MSVLVDWQIRDLCVLNKSGYVGNSNWFRQPEDGKEGYIPLPMIESFSESVKVPGVISYGLTHAGYDLRLGYEFVQFINPVLTYGQIPIIDPKRFGDANYEQNVIKRFSQNHPVTIPPNSYILGMSLEYLRIPDWLKGNCTGKSTLARSGILINTTPLEPGWQGHLCIEIGNVTNLPAVIYPGEGICQLEFTRLDAGCEKTYRGKGYDKQTGVTLAKV